MKIRVTSKTYSSHAKLQSNSAVVRASCSKSLKPEAPPEAPSEELPEEPPEESPEEPPEEPPAQSKPSGLYLFPESGAEIAAKSSAVMVKPEVLP